MTSSCYALVLACSQYARLCKGALRQLQPASGDSGTAPLAGTVGMHHTECECGTDAHCVGHSHKRVCTFRWHWHGHLHGWQASATE
jgi:hypothetical protein